jgi:hypothetical protein
MRNSATLITMSTQVRDQNGGAVGNVLQMKDCQIASYGLGFDLLCRFWRRLRNAGLAVAQTQRAPPAILALWFRPPERRHHSSERDVHSECLQLGLSECGCSILVTRANRGGSVTSEVTTFGYVKAGLLLFMRFPVVVHVQGCRCARAVEFGH